MYAIRSYYVPVTAKALRLVVDDPEGVHPLPAVRGIDVGDLVGAEGEKLGGRNQVAGLFRSGRKQNPATRVEDMYRLDGRLGIDLLEQPDHFGGLAGFHCPDDTVVYGFDQNLAGLRRKTIV